MIIDLATRLKQLRLERRLRQDQVADLIGVTRSAISAYENDLRQPSYDILIRFANLYRVSSDYLLGRADEQTIDTADLTESDVALVRELIVALSLKNKKIEGL